MAPGSLSNAMGWQLATGVGYCEVGGEIVFLDLARDKYLALRGKDRAAFGRLRSGEPNDSDAMERLVQTGLLARCTRPARLDPAEVNIPVRDLSTIRDRGFSVAMSLRAAHALHRAKRSMRPGRIAATIDKLQRSKRRIGVPGADAAVVDVAARYAACRWINPTPPRCLVDSLALDRILLSRGLAATMVFGVRLAPFAAHCWLQTPETILTGTAAEAHGFTPILVVG